MDGYFVGRVKDEPHRADVVRAATGEELTGPDGGYDSWDGPFTKHGAYAAASESGRHVTEAEPGCGECADAGLVPA